MSPHWLSKTKVQLSKALDKPVDKLLLRPASFYKDYDIEDAVATNLLQVLRKLDI